MMTDLIFAIFALIVTPVICYQIGKWNEQRRRLRKHIQLIEAWRSEGFEYVDKFEKKFGFASTLLFYDFLFKLGDHIFDEVDDIK